jgi:hypothetical protein
MLSGTISSESEWAGRSAVWRSRAWWFFVGLLAAALTAVLVIAFVTSSPSTSYGGRAPQAPGVSAPAAPYPGPNGAGTSSSAPSSTP